MACEPPGRGARAAESARLESVCGATHRGFESHPLRQLRSRSTRILGAMVFQSLYRRYRPRRFSEMRGQDHIKLALRNAVRDDTVSHAYLFSGPRGTGKTT